MDEKSIADLSEQIAFLIGRISEVRQKSDPFAALVLDEVRQHIVQADDWMCRLANARKQVSPIKGVYVQELTAGQTDCDTLVVTPYQD